MFQLNAQKYITFIYSRTIRWPLHCCYMLTYSILGYMLVSNLGFFASKHITCKFRFHHISIIISILIIRTNLNDLLLIHQFYFQVWKRRYKINCHDINQWDVDFNFSSLSRKHSIGFGTKTSIGKLNIYVPFSLILMSQKCKFKKNHSNILVRSFMF